MEMVLLLLRFISASFLLTLLAAIFIIAWRDYRHTITQAESNRRAYGYLVVVEKRRNKHVATGETHTLQPLTCLGRAPTNNIIIDDTFASGEHAQVILRDGRWWLEDRNSRNGTTLNELIIHQPVVITGGDIIGIGQKLFQINLE
jgi:hypothetical protein